MSREHDSGSHPRKPRRQDGRPNIATVVAVDDLNFMPANPSGTLKDETGFQPA
jgi:hypothetical protein